VSGTDDTADDPGPPVFSVLFHTPGPKWAPGVSFQEQPGVEQHVRYMASFLKSGRLVCGGPFLDDSGGMMVFRGSQVEATVAAEADPAVKAGLLKVVVRTWMVPMATIELGEPLG
jgi:uncharacterized protein YciI